ncbi:EAL domain-containing protein [filamentous cyanobacterium LEGE 11480]|uniref:EAL domain-containing protein n=1 Tax=Romeriopsis navalis LEGE 11480 TaxID=2777977 RepID=A0A928Z307_9CYAN|nr:EAL domain-containing protein [Romeriopsis navalis]MBE9030976.1 EAL domain-containing protein [Romeriopsis navalis LEGE 11480]
MSKLLAAQLASPFCPPNASPSILVVDDIPDNLRLLSTTLTQVGYNVRGAINGAIAMMSITMDAPDLILLDVTMPGMDGFEVCQQLKAAPETAEIPVIFISALGAVLDKVKAFEVGGSDYITKPFQIEEVLARVQAHVELSQLKQQLKHQNQRLQTMLALQQQAETQVLQLNQELEQRVLERTSQLQAANHRLQQEMQERQQAQAEVLHLAMYDPLTGLANRTRLLECLNQVLTPRQTDSAPTVSDHNPVLLLLDCARFETITDTLGHRRGDQLLITIAQRLTAVVAEPDLVAKLRGDEFAILLNLPNRSIERFIQTLRQSLAQPIALGEYDVILNPWIGIALPDAHCQDAEHLFRNAYQAMVRAKHQGIGCWQIFQPEMHQQAVHRLMLEGRLHRAIQQHQIQVYYQPIMALSDDSDTPTIVGFEALARWQLQPEAQFISPAEFILLAEETGLILPLGDLVFETACRQIRAWNQDRQPDQALSMSINFSVHQLKREHVAEHIATILERTQVQPEWLKLEITESVLMQNPQAVLNALEQLRFKGLQVSIDDFGTGYSSLSYLQSLPVDILKIDRAFVKDLASDQDDLRILETIVSLAHALDLDVIAEGIETPHQATRLRQLGVGYGQGYLFAKPLEGQAAGALMQLQD